MLKSLKNLVGNHAAIKKQHKTYRIKWRNIEEGDYGKLSFCALRVGSCAYIFVALDNKHISIFVEGYLTNFCFDFVTDMKKCIAQCVDQRMRERNFTETSDVLLEEVAHHARFQYTKIVDFRGRVQLIGKYDIIYIIITFLRCKCKSLISSALPSSICNIKILKRRAAYITSAVLSAPKTT